MSWVANVMLSVEREDHANAEEFSRWLDKECPRRESGMGRGGCGSLALVTGADTSGLQRLVDEDQDHADQQAATNS
jgi:hypothetical protein